MLYHTVTLGAQVRWVLPTDRAGWVLGWRKATATLVVSKPVPFQTQARTVLQQLAELIDT